jgi:hypothetical protein
MVKALFDPETGIPPSRPVSGGVNTHPIEW